MSIFLMKVEGVLITISFSRNWTEKGGIFNFDARSVELTFTLPLYLQLSKEAYLSLLVESTLTRCWTYRANRFAKSEFCRFLQ
jgi:hypothetical protein